MCTHRAFNVVAGEDATVEARDDLMVHGDHAAGLSGVQVWKWQVFRVFGGSIRRDGSLLTERTRPHDSSRCSGGVGFDGDQGNQETGIDIQRCRFVPNVRKWALFSGFASPKAPLWNVSYRRIHLHQCNRLSASTQVLAGIDFP